MSERDGAASWRDHLSPSVLGPAVVIGLGISFLFSVILEPIASYARSGIGHSAGWVGNRFVDGAAVLAVQGPDGAALRFVLVAIFYAAVMAAYGFVFYANQLRRRVQAHMGEAARLEAALGDLGLSAEVEGPMESPLTRVGAMKAKISTLLREVNITVLQAWAGVAIVALSGGWHVGQIHLAYSMRETFDLKVVALSVGLTETERRKVDAAWAMCRSAADVKRLNKQLDQMASDKRISLPALS